MTIRLTSCGSWPASPLSDRPRSRDGTTVAERRERASASSCYAIPAGQADRLPIALTKMPVAADDRRLAIAGAISFPRSVTPTTTIRYSRRSIASDQLAGRPGARRDANPLPSCFRWGENVYAPPWRASRSGAEMNTYLFFAPGPVACWPSAHAETYGESSTGRVEPAGQAKGRATSTPAPKRNSRARELNSSCRAAAMLTR